MNALTHELARAQMTARLGEAQQLRRGHRQARDRRLHRRAEKAVQQARLATARSF